MTEAETQAQAEMAVQSLKKSVKEALERKRRLGQYVVVWRNGKPERLIDAPPDQPEDRRHGAA
ncbi:MAG: hypothetical protein IT565_03965 [Rhodospirillales bacterium]|nr:hypothetical protein [Rhodospirillales bacterium]